MKVSKPKPILSSTGFAILAGFFCFMWAFIAWLSVIPNQDILADAVQVQSLFHDPRVVLSFPGQKHGGPVEYPFQILAELLAPGNFYVHTFPRVIFAFLTGFFTAKLFMQLFPKAQRWSFLVAILIGPTIIHGLSGPEGNTVGVWWLVGNYSTSWLLVVLGSYLFTRSTLKGGWRIPVSGVLIGLGFFAHPNVTILILPLGVLILLITRPAIRQIVLLLGGFLVGIVPAVLSYLFFTGNNTWDPSRVPFFVRDIYLNSLGLNGIPDYISVVLPYAFGLPPSQNFISGPAQSGVTWLLVLAVIVIATTGWIMAIRTRTWPRNFVLISTAWCGAIFSIVLFVTFVDTVWFYATSLSVLFWMTMGALPTAISPRWLAVSITIAFLTLEGTSMVTHNWVFYKDLPAHIESKRQYQSEITFQAELLRNRGVQVVYGSYLDVIPISYASSFELRPISVRYDRFPLMGSEIDQTFTTAVNANPTDPWGEEGLRIASSSCQPLESLSISSAQYIIYSCPGQVISQGS